MRIATHSGSFHADDVFAVAILQLINPDATVVRTRDEELMQAADLRLDVGMKYDHETRDYDHHQKEGAGKRENEIPYAAAGLIWKHYGMQLAKEEEVWQKIDDKIIQQIDAADNGVQTFTPDIGFPYTLHEIIRSFNPGWNDEHANQYDSFLEAVEFAKGVLRRELKKAMGNKLAEQLVLNAIKQSDGKTIILDRFCPWKSTVIEHSEALFVVYPSFEEKWNVQAIPKEPEGFAVRKQFPEEWAGLTGEDLARVSGIPDAVFCHRGRFLAGAVSREGAIKMAELAQQ